MRFQGIEQFGTDTWFAVFIDDRNQQLLFSSKSLIARIENLKDVEMDCFVEQRALKLLEDKIAQKPVEEGLEDVWEAICDEEDVETESYNQ